MRARLSLDRGGPALTWAASLVCALVLTGAVVAIGAAGQAAASGGAAPIAPAPTTHHRFAVGEMVVTFVDRSRQIRLPNGRFIPRRVVTMIRYPALGAPSQVAVRGRRRQSIRAHFRLLYSATDSP